MDVGPGPPPAGLCASVGWSGRHWPPVNQCDTFHCPPQCTFDVTNFGLETNVRAYCGGSDGPLHVSGIMRHVAENHATAVLGVVGGRNRTEIGGRRVASVPVEPAARADALRQQDFNLDWRGSQRQT